MLSSVEQAFVGRDETRAPLKTPAWEASQKYPKSHPWGGGLWLLNGMTLQIKWQHDKFCFCFFAVVVSFFFAKNIESG